MDLNKQLQHFKLLTPTARFTDWLDQPDPDAQAGCTRRVASTLQARLVFSWLAYRARHGLGASTRGICREVGLHPATVATALNSLGTLVSRCGNEWVASEPPDALFVPRRCDEQPKHWADRLAYTLLYLPRRGAKIQYKETSRRFGLNHAIIWSHLFRKAKNGNVQGFTYAGAAMLFGLDPKTVSSVINDLLWAKMIAVEDLGRSYDITVLAPTDEHLALFEPKPEPERKKVEPVEKKPRPAPAPYKYTGGKCDVCRKLCEGLMPQNVAEAAIKKAQRLGDTSDDFENQFLQAKGFHDKNLLSGKVAHGNFGKYLNKCYDTRIAKLEEQEKAEERERRLEEYVNSAEFKKKQQEREQAIAAEPSDPCHLPSAESILDRVQIDPSGVRNRLDADRLVRMVWSHCRSFEYEHRLAGPDPDRADKLYKAILRTALLAVNHYYKQPLLATPEEFRNAIDAAIHKIEPQMKPLFKKEFASA
jgi:hypothetical protein